jgi:hypothetical protein
MLYQKELSIAAIAVVVLLMIFKPSVLGIVYNNMLGKLFLVACIVFLTLKHTIAGLLGVVFIAVIASNSVFEGAENKGDKKEEDEKDATKPAATVSGDSSDAGAAGGEANPNIAAASAALKALGGK